MHQDGAHVGWWAEHLRASNSTPAHLPTVVSSWSGEELQTSAPPAGARELQGFDLDRLTEVGEMHLQVRALAAEFADELTVYKSMGHAVEDVAAARPRTTAANAEGAGIHLPL